VGCWLVGPSGRRAGAEGAAAADDDVGGLEALGFPAWVGRAAFEHLPRGGNLRLTRMAGRWHWDWGRPFGGTACRPW
jgi:hypothetical protein